MRTAPFIALLLCTGALRAADPHPPTVPAPAPGSEPAPQEIPRTWLGVAVARVSPALALQWGLPAGAGLQVELVIPDSPAAAAGIQPRDVLVRLGDQLLVNQEQLGVVLGTHPDGARTTIRIMRKGKEQSLEVALKQRLMPQEPATVWRAEQQDALGTPKPWHAVQQDLLSIPEPWRAALQDALGMPEPWRAAQQDALGTPAPWHAAPPGDDLQPMPGVGPGAEPLWLRYVMPPSISLSDSTTQVNWMVADKGGMVEVREGGAVLFRGTADEARARSDLPPLVDRLLRHPPARP